MRRFVPVVACAWRWGIVLIIAAGLIGACPDLTGTAIPFLLVCCQVLVILALFALTIAASVWRATPARGPQTARNRERKARTLPAIPAGEEQYASQYEQPSATYPELLPPQ